ncbi:hypothetical protein DH2020_045511 [Rehmannia glutinosa]|uniref:G domain-containing protein n=1 Tax=Rehmannia glutinosa TaxID=99300 RepID=A0ABR0UEK6_REHGL
MAATGGLIQEIGKAVKAVAKGKGSKWWYTPHMAAASRAIAERIPLVDLVLEVRDAREWMKFFEEQKSMVFGVNSHNRDNIKEVNLQAFQFPDLSTSQSQRIEEKDDPAHAITLMLVGIPNVGKSALANSLHQVGRIAAAVAEAVIFQLQIASHPNIYVLDTPGVLPPDVVDDGVCSKLALTGAIKDDVDFIVNNVRRSLFDAVSSFAGCIENGENLARLIEEEFEVLLKVFYLPLESKESNYCRVATKLLNLYRTGRLGHYTLDPVPSNAHGILL